MQGIWGKDITKVSSRNHPFSDVVAEAKEIIEEFPNPHKMWEEFQDTTTAFMCWAAMRGVNLWAPIWCTSYKKYLRRMETLKQLMVREGLWSELRAAEDPFYHRAYVTEGTNIDKPRKREAFLSAALRDFRR